jgi:hypothetical protein
LLLYSSNLLLGFPTSRSFTSSATRHQMQTRHFLAPFITAPSMTQCQFPVFCYFCVLEKLHRKYSWNWTKQKPNLLIFNEASRRPKRRRRGATGWPATGPHALWVRPPWPASDAAPSPIKTPQWEKPKAPIYFLETHRDPPPSSTRDREGPEALPDTLPERGITTGGLLHRYACLRCDE